MSEIEYKVLYPKIHLYKNLIPNPEVLVQMLKDSENNPGSSKVFDGWLPWSRFGTYLDKTPIPDLIAETTKDSEKNEKFYNELKYAQIVWNAFYTSTDHFLKKYNVIKNENWVVMGPSYSRYFYDNNPRSNKEIMAHHTDFVKIEENMPGNKFAVTCTMYLNDDYIGGDIDFLIKNDNISYKPKAGDVLVFPSGHPDVLSDGNTYLHGVKRVQKSDKYLIRCFYQIPYSGSPEWLANQKKYGKELWAEMEKKRIALGRRYHYDS
jgi:hypothetical protein